MAQESARPRLFLCDPLPIFSAFALMPSGDVVHYACRRPEDSVSLASSEKEAPASSETGGARDRAQERRPLSWRTAH